MQLGQNEETLLNCLDLSVTDECNIDETRAWRTKCRPGTAGIFVSTKYNTNWTGNHIYLKGKNIRTQKI